MNHPTKDKRFHCGYCDRKYTALTSLKLHINDKHHTLRKIASSKELLSCNECDKLYIELDHLDRHVFQNHSLFEEITENSKSLRTVVDDSKGESSTKQTEAMNLRDSPRFEDKNEIEIVDSKTEDDKIIKENAKSKQKLQNFHSQTAEQQSISNRTFNKSSSGLFECHICPAVFTNEKSLDIHLLLHRK
ncbi:PR domain zinc finger protein 4-like [Centruroides vittatus]|uniref:PR domain zinc finger protein 4-like n=1 Tax=Centruroides vittatus TaxID=120091 RepID=UPI00351041BE